jgi:Ser/Thr protein kinase RdoA (MazF antagonist)
VHFGNLLIDEGIVTLFDFDDCAYSWFVEDVAVLLFFSICNFSEQGREGHFAHHFLKRFREGYESLSRFGDDIIASLPLFLKRRELNLFVALSNLPVNEHYDFERRFMENRRTRIENEIPFVPVGT